MFCEENQENKQEVLPQIQEFEISDEHKKSLVLT